ncbi:hypothetical protein SAMN05216252_11125 [Actinacidiphila glaucinigra]|uniref:Uncharacterized protein n=1 Tax=Actinacidiphila glaucinigra TaxID=235986 RepID=A0A239ILJ6_9ACTN|nr:hypothetical protein SAMN05216252_11125 [Actinacidiphila glaucinigra]
MPEQTPQARHLAIHEHAPRILPDFEAHWRRAIGDAFNPTPIPAFMRSCACGGPSTPSPATLALQHTYTAS